MSEQKNNPIIIAHRGFSAKYIENSFESYDEAIKAGADTVECDIRSCKSGELVLMHDKTTDRTCKVDGKISTLTLDEIKKIPLRNNQEIPTLLEFLGKYRGKVKMMWDVKTPIAAKELVSLIRKYKLHNDVFISSEITTLLIDILIRDPEIETAISFAPKKYLKYLFFKKLFILPARLVGANRVTIHYKVVNQKMIERAHKNGLKILVFPVDHEKDIKRLANQDVDAIITDNTQLVKKILES
jgi:glycerophosphoryl diester phosphodiesterase